MEPLELVVKHAKTCHTKSAWEALFAKEKDTIASTQSGKSLSDLFRVLKSDPQSLQYDPMIWAVLLKGALSSWSFELGKEIAAYTEKIPFPAVIISSAQIFLETGQPAKTRDMANRALRFTNLKPPDRIELQMLICGAYAEEGKHNKTIRMLKSVHESLEKTDLPEKDRATYLMRIGRMHFFLGQYSQAGEVFLQASKIFRRLQNWDMAAKALFNTAASYENSGNQNQHETFKYVEECRRIAEAHNLHGHLAHCEAFYGLDAHNRGNFASAREHFRRGLEHLPSDDNSFRRLHILSMLAIVYMRMGRYHLAKRFAKQTLELARLDESDRYKTRYTTLESELLWEEGDIDRSQEILRMAILPLESAGIQNLEEMSTLTRFNHQSALLGERQISSRFRISEELQRHDHSWIERRITLGELLLNREDYKLAQLHFDSCMKSSQKAGYLYLEALATEGLIQCLLKQRKFGEHLDEAVRQFAVNVSRIGDTPLKAQLQTILASQAYNAGDFKECTRLIKEASKLARVSFVDRFCLQGCLATIEGKSPRLVHGWQLDLFARFVRTYFSPTIKAEPGGVFVISDHYTVDLGRHPSLADFVNFLLNAPDFRADREVLQKKVWGQSTDLQGWEQKIRNSVMRIRDLFPYTIAPLLLQTHEVRVFKEALSIYTAKDSGRDVAEEMLRILRDSPLSSGQMAKRLEISNSTAKRTLKKLTDSNAISIMKKGRNIYYFAE